MSNKYGRQILKVDHPTIGHGRLISIAAQSPDAGVCAVIACAWKTRFKPLHLIFAWEYQLGGRFWLRLRHSVEETCLLHDMRSNRRRGIRLSEFCKAFDILPSLEAEPVSGNLEGFPWPRMQEH